MEIKIKDSKGKDKIVEMKNVKNKHVEEMLNELKGLKDLDEDTALVKLSGLLETRNRIARGLTGMTEEEWSELDVVDSDKFTSVVANAAFGDLDFSRLFKKRQG